MLGQKPLRAARSCAIHAGRRATCWGAVVPEASDAFDDRPPQLLGGVANATQLALDLRSRCALLGDGSVACWGFGTSNGQVNQGGYPQSPQRNRSLSRGCPASGQRDRWV